MGFCLLICAGQASGDPYTHTISDLEFRQVSAEVTSLSVETQRSFAGEKTGLVVVGGQPTSGTTASIDWDQELAGQATSAVTPEVVVSRDPFTVSIGGEIEATVSDGYQSMTSYDCHISRTTSPNEKLDVSLFNLNSPPTPYVNTQIVLQTQNEDPVADPSHCSPTYAPPFHSWIGLNSGRITILPGASYTWPNQHWQNLLPLEHAESSTGPTITKEACSDVHCDFAIVGGIVSSITSPPYQNEDDRYSTNVDWDVTGTASGRYEAGIRLTYPQDEVDPDPEVKPKPPVTVILSGPKKRIITKTGSAKVAFRFKSTPRGATFKCKLDAKAFKTCRSPFKAKVKKGKHAFKVYAVYEDQADLSPASYKWSVKKKKQKRARSRR